MSESRGSGGDPPASASSVSSSWASVVGTRPMSLGGQSPRQAVSLAADLLHSGLSTGQRLVHKAQHLLNTSLSGSQDTYHAQGPGGGAGGCGGGAGAGDPSMFSTPHKPSGMARRLNFVAGEDQQDETGAASAAASSASAAAFPSSTALAVQRRGGPDEARALARAPTEASRTALELGTINYALGVANMAANRRMFHTVSELKATVLDQSVELRDLNESVSDLRHEADFSRQEAERLKQSLCANTALLETSLQQMSIERDRQAALLDETRDAVIQLRRSRVKMDAVVDAVLAAVSAGAVNLPLLDWPLRLALATVLARNSRNVRRARAWVRQLVKLAVAVAMWRFLRQQATALGLSSGVGSAKSYAEALAHAMATAGRWGWDATVAMASPARHQQTPPTHGPTATAATEALQSPPQTPLRSMAAAFLSGGPRSLNTASPAEWSSD
eukprot:m.10236 g.10236  ORF g.10236 m.10236 type:complete len:445 (+) comp3730_c0_seq1:311-1645(+)